MRSIDWGRTPVGPVSSWPESLRTTVGTLLHSRHPMFLWWGPELVQFYNDAYLPSFGVGKHPLAMGQRGVDCWQEIWPIIWPQIDGVMARANSSWNEDHLVPVWRNGRLEEVYWTYGYSPVFLENGAVGGTLVVCTETTSRVLAVRRLRSLRELSDRTAVADEPAELYPVAREILSRCSSDIPFALLYARDPSTGAARLTSSIGLDDGALDAVDAALRLRIDASLRCEKSLVGPLALADEVVVPLPGTPWPECATHLFVAEIPAPATTAHLAGVMVFGLSPRLLVDDEYCDYLLHFTEHFSVALSRIASFRARASAESERRSLLQQAPVATALLSGPHHRFELANSHFERVADRALVGKTFREAFPELVETPIPAILDRVYRTGERYVTNETLAPLARSGEGAVEDRFFMFNLEPLRDPAANVYGMMAVAMDVTDSVKARHALEKSNREREALLADLESASRAKDEFLAMLGHELRNPLSPIVTALQIMKLRSNAPPSREEQVIERQVTHLIRLVDDLLDVSKITRGKVELRKETVEVSEVLTKAVEMASVLFEQRSHQLLIQCPRTGLRWFGDPVRLAQVVANLLTNAARYTAVGGKVELSAVADGEDVVIRVADTGIGIAAATLPTIFEMFVQAKRSADRSEGGLGLGLALVKTLVAMHGGSVAARSEGLGKGSEFVIRLPRAAHATGEEPTAVLPQREQAGARSRRVLVVDDNEDAAELLSHALRMAGHEVTVAHDPLLALEGLRQADPEVAVLDIGLPVMDGYELASRLREAVPGCRLIALTGYGQDHDIERSREAGFEKHLIKPVNLDELLRLVLA